MTVDQPLFALAKEIQLGKLEFLGEDKFLVMIDDLHIEMTFMKCLDVTLFVEFSYLGLWRFPGLDLLSFFKYFIIKDRGESLLSYLITSVVPQM